MSHDQPATAARLRSRLRRRRRPGLSITRMAAQPAPAPRSAPTLRESVEQYVESLRTWIRDQHGGSRQNALTALTDARAKAGGSAGPLPGEWTTAARKNARWSRSAWYRLASGTLPPWTHDTAPGTLSDAELEALVPDRLRLVSAVLARDVAAGVPAHADLAYRRHLRRAADAQFAQQQLSGGRSTPIRGTEIGQLNAWMAKVRWPAIDPVLAAEQEDPVEQGLWTQALSIAQRREAVRFLGARTRNLNQLITACVMAQGAGDGLRLEGDCGVVVAGLRRRRALLFDPPSDAPPQPQLSHDTLEMVADALAHIANGLVNMWNGRDGIVGANTIYTGGPPYDDGDILTAMHALLIGLGASQIRTPPGQHPARQP